MKWQCRFSLCYGADLFLFLGQQVENLAGGLGLAEQEALGLGEAVDFEIFHFFRRFDALACGRHAEARAESRDRANDCLGILVGIEIAHKRLVELDLVEREAAQIAERGISGAEIVHRYLDAERAQLMKRRQGVLVVHQQYRFGDLQF